MVRQMNAMPRGRVHESVDACERAFHIAPLAQVGAHELGARDLDGRDVQQPHAVTAREQQGSKRSAERSRTTRNDNRGWHASYSPVS
jgi:hypothetical protein